MWYVGLAVLVVLSVTALVFALFVEIGPKVRFLRRARRCRCRLLAVRREAEPNGIVAQRHVFHVELLAPPALAGRRIVATSRPEPGPGTVYTLGSHAERDAARYEVGGEYDCWLEPDRPEQGAMSPRPSMMVGATLGLVGAAGLILATLLALRVVEVTVSP